MRFQTHFLLNGFLASINDRAKAEFYTISCFISGQNLESPSSNIWGFSDNVTAFTIFH